MDILYNIAITPIEMIVEFIFSIMYDLFDNPGTAIIFVSIIVQLLVLPMYKRSDALQEEERNKQKEMEKWVKHIKATFKGDERFMMLQAYYREVNYKPASAIKGSFSLLLQIPFFVAAYHYLSNLSVLQQASYIGIADLSRPDGLISIAGISINLLPVLMTLFNVISGIIYTKGFPLKDKVQTYGLAAIFLVLLYDSPSGLVFYWTLNNLFSLLKNVFMKLVKRPRPVINVLCAAGGLVVFGNRYLVMRDNIEGTIFFIILCFLPLILSAVKRFAKKSDKPEKIYIHDKNEKTLFNLSSVLLTIVMGLTIPLSVISSSAIEFYGSGYSPIGLAIKTCSVFVGFILVWIRIFYALCNDKAKHYFTYAMSAFSIIAVINHLFFAKDLGTLSTALVYDENPLFSATAVIINLLVLFAAAAVIIILLKLKPAIAKRVYQIATLTFAVLAVTSIFTIKNDIADYKVPTFDKSSDKSPIYNLSTEGQNVVVLMLDRAISGYLPYFLQENPKLLEMYDGFTYYPNTLSYGGNTNFASPALFGGYEYTPAELDARDNELLGKKHNEALKMMPQLFSDEGYNVTVTDPPYAGYRWDPDLSIYKDIKNVTAIKTEGKYAAEAKTEYGPLIDTKQKRNFICYSIMKSMPVFSQLFFYHSGNYWSTMNTDILNSSFLDWYTALDCMPEVTQIKNDSSNNLLVLQNSTAHEAVHLQAPNYEPSLNPTSIPADNPENYVIDGKAVDVSNSWVFDHYQVNMAAIMRVGEWLDYLKEQGVYDNTRIIIVADHGFPLGQFEDMKLENGIDVQRFNPLLMVKDFNAKGFTTSDEFMTNADVPTLATQGIISNPTNPYTGNAINSSAKNEPQLITTSENWSTSNNRGYKFNTADGEWYSVTKNIFDVNNWKFVKKGTEDASKGKGKNK